MSKTALITGASSGIGKDLAKRHAENGDNLVIVARRKDRLLELKKELENKHDVKVTVISLDLTDRNAPETLYKKIKKAGIKIDYLINNAGFGLFGRFDKTDRSTDLNMIDLNIRALTELTHLFLPDMVKRNTGKIMNVASVVGFLPGPFNSVYFASKAFVVSFTEALAEELRGTGITVTALCPGATKTEFGKVAKMKAFDKYKNIATAEQVASFGFDSMMKGKTIAIYGAANRSLINLTRFLPRKAVSKMTRKMMEDMK